MSETPDKLTPEEREELVAYLDGELSDDRAQEVEATLNKDAAARGEAEALQRTWDMLDYLPRPKAPESFTHNTMERLATQSIRLAVRRRWVQRVAWAGAVAAAGLISFFVMFYFAAQSPDPNATGRGDTPPGSDGDVPPELRRVVENRNLLVGIDNLDFAEKLAHPDLFGEDP